VTENNANPNPGARTLSVDVLRGVVMLTMVFVNDVAGVKAAPWWMQHYFPHDASGMTFVDVVFPAFLFIVGMSVPLAFQSRANRGEPIYLTLFHVLLRTLELLLLGFIMVNVGGVVPKLGLSPTWWKTLIYLSMILTFLALPRSDSARRVMWIVKGTGLSMLIFLASIYRTKAGGWMTPQWWGILGLIGWAYLVCSIAWLLSFNLRPILFLFAAGTMSLFVLDARGTFDSWKIAHLVSIGTMLGSHTSIAIMGAIIGSMLRQDSLQQSHAARISSAVEFVITASVLALLMHNPWGINKNAATPAWCFWCSAITAAIWMTLYLLIDVAGMRRWTGFFAATGSCALMIYLLHPLFIYVTSLTGWTAYGHWGQGVLWMGVTRSVGCAVGLSSIAIGLSKLGIRLKL
jgi:predicted acyltransferase